MATILESRYPYVYPRDSSSASMLFRQMVEKDLDSNGDAFNILKGMAKFIAYVQDESGKWGQRYGLNGQDKAIYIQEDNTAYGAIILANYLLTCYARNEEPAELGDYLKRIKRQYSMLLNIFTGGNIPVLFDNGNT